MSCRRLSLKLGMMLPCVARLSNVKQDGLRYAPNGSKNVDCLHIKHLLIFCLQAEDAYANFLVREFEHGIARGVQNQTTLRAYLSRKLVCTPMRISKKFTGELFYFNIFIYRSSFEINSKFYLKP